MRLTDSSASVNKKPNYFQAVAHPFRSDPPGVLPRPITDRGGSLEKNRGGVLEESGRQVGEQKPVSRSVTARE
jgi:hypothetical protein